MVTRQSKIWLTTLCAPLALLAVSRWIANVDSPDEATNTTIGLGLLLTTELYKLGLTGQATTASSRVLSAKKGGMCPSSNPFAYFDNSAYCCKTNKEKKDPGLGAACDGSEFDAGGVLSKCCENDQLLACKMAPCSNYEGDPISTTAIEVLTTTTVKVAVKPLQPDNEKKPDLQKHKKVVLGIWDTTTLEPTTTTTLERLTTTNPPPRPMETVPTVFHYHHEVDKLCAGESFTQQPDIGCNGWSGMTETQCQEKCANNEMAPNCPREPCIALGFYEQGGWCHLFAPGECTRYSYAFGAKTSKKVPGGGSLKKDTGGAGTANAKGKGDIFAKKHLPAVIGGAAGGALVGGALMAGVGAIVSNIKGSKVPVPPSGQGGLLARLKKGMIIEPNAPPTVTITTILTTTTTSTATATTTLPSAPEMAMMRQMLKYPEMAFRKIQEGMAKAKSGGPMVPLVCLSLVCACGLCALLLASLLDPCQRKRVHRGVVEGGSVASIGSIGSFASTEGNSEEASHLADDYAGYGNSVATVGEYSQYDYDSYGGSVGMAYDYDSFGGSVASAYTAGNYGSVADTGVDYSEYEYGSVAQDLYYSSTQNQPSGYSMQPRYMSAIANSRAPVTGSPYPMSHGYS